MAINVWYTGLIDPSAASKPDAADHVHNIKRGTADAQDITVSFDKAKVVTRTVLRSALLQILRVADGGSELTP